MALSKLERRQRIKNRIRKVVSGTAAQPRLSVFRSNKEIYAQLVDDVTGVTLVAASSRDKESCNRIKIRSCCISRKSNSRKSCKGWYRNYFF